MKKKIIALTTILLSTIVSNVYANDRGIEGAGGSFQVLKGEHPSISMVSEIIKMDIYRDYYNVTAEFLFENSSDKPVTVNMGFPENNHGDINMTRLKEKSGFLMFKTSVDGKGLKVSRRQVTTVSEEEQAIRAHWIKEVSFKPLQKRRVKVEYRSKTGAIALPGIFTEYNFTGGNWKGKVSESILKATMHLPANYSVNYGEFSTPKDLVKKGNTLYFYRKNWEADYVLPIMIQKK